jgi:hypothetical protein
MADSNSIHARLHLGYMFQSGSRVHKFVGALAREHHFAQIVDNLLPLGNNHS